MEAEQEVPWPWIVDYTPEGVAYYTNEETGETVWELPSDEQVYELENGENYDDAVVEEWGGGDEIDTNFEENIDEGWGYETNEYESPAPTQQVHVLPSSIVQASSPVPTLGTDAWGNNVNNKETEISFKVIQTPLFQACENHDVDSVLSILEGYPTLISFIVNEGNSAGMTPLHVCCLFGSEKCGTALIANKANVNAMDKFGSGCLHYLARSRVPSPNLLRLLLSKGCDVLYEETLAHYIAREELVLEHQYLRASPDSWYHRISAFDGSCPDTRHTMNHEIDPNTLATLPLPLGWEKHSDEVGVYYYSTNNGNSSRERPEGTSPRGAYEYLLNRFNSYLARCLPWYGGRGPGLKSGSVEYEDEDRLWLEGSKITLKVVSAMAPHTSESSEAPSNDAEVLTGTQRRTIECYCILRREELRSGLRASTAPADIALVSKNEFVKRPVKTARLGLCGYWNPLVALKVLALLMDRLASRDEEQRRQNEDIDSMVTSSTLISRRQSHIKGIAATHISSGAPPRDFDVAQAEMEERSKRSTQLAKSEKMLRRLESEGKKDGEQAVKLRKEVERHRTLFEAAHRAWLTKIAVHVFPQRVALCEKVLHDMGFTLPTIAVTEEPDTAQHGTKPPPEPSAPLSVESSEDNDTVKSAESTESEMGEPPLSDPPMPINGWTPLDVAWTVFKRLPPSVALSDRKDIFKSIIFAEVSGMRLFPLVAVEEGSEPPAQPEAEEVLPANSAIFPKVSPSEKLRIDFVVNSLGFDNQLKHVWISTVFRSLLLRSKRWTQMNALGDEWSPPTVSQAEDGKLLEHVIERIGSLMVKEEGGLRVLTNKLTQHRRETVSVHSHSSHGSAFSFMDAVHAKEAEILEQHVRYQHEQRCLLSETLGRFKHALLPLPAVAVLSPTSPKSMMSPKSPKK
mmetsp:Transcript_25345/g.30041  ORF Transcript_25345/g.30041 Transcript_25345/m.30041 type:complete len:911 (-) Transcript_25345:389-3121(-)